MTEKKEARLRKKISDIKRHLAAEKRKFGCYDDSRGLRYIPLELYIKLGDFKGGMNYVRWFYRNFPDDIGFPEFLFESAIIQFKSNKLKDAEQKIWETFESNTYILDKFFGRPIKAMEKYEWSNSATTEYLNYFNYRAGQKDLEDFTKWLADLERTPIFQDKVTAFIFQQKSKFRK